MDKQRRTIETLYLAIAALAWIYLWLRAWNVQMAHDEIATFFYYIQTGEFLPSIAHWDANNHILNSALSWVFYKMFGHSELVFRLANVLAFPLMAIYWMLIARKIRNKWLQVAFLLAFPFMHNFIEFFALSRGYGLSMGFITAAIFHLMAYMENSRQRNLTAVLLFTLLAVASNLSLYILSLLILLIATLKSLSGTNFRINRKILPDLIQITLLGVFPSVLFAIILFMMKEQDLLYYGAQDGIWKVTARSVITLLSGSPAKEYEWFWGALIAASLPAGLIIAYKNRSRLFSGPAPVLFFTLFWGSVAATIALNLILGINYPEDRVGIYFYPLLAGMFFLCFDAVLKNNLKWLLALLFLWLPVDFILKTNLSHAQCYKTDYIPEVFFQRVAGARETGKLPPTIGTYRTRHFVWSYFDYVNGGSTVAPIFHSNYPGNLTDYVITDPELYPDWEEYYESIDYDLINGRLLMKRKEPVKTSVIDKRPALTTEGLTDHEYFLLFGMDAGSLAGKDIKLDFDIRIESPASPFEARLVFSVEDDQMNDLRYEYIQLNWMRKEWNSKITNTLLMHDIPQNASYLRFYIWSIEGAPYNIPEGKCSLSGILTDPID